MTYNNPLPGRKKRVGLCGGHKKDKTSEEQADKESISALRKEKPHITVYNILDVNCSSFHRVHSEERNVGLR